jgi:hypothetical protein
MITTNLTVTSIGTATCLAFAATFATGGCGAGVTMAAATCTLQPSGALIYNYGTCGSTTWSANPTC